MILSHRLIYIGQGELLTKHNASKVRFFEELNFEWGNKVDWANVEINIGTNVDRGDKCRQESY